MATKKRKATTKKARAPRTSTPRAVKQSASVVVDGCTTTRTYPDGGVNTTTHINESVAKAYAASVKEGS